MKVGELIWQLQRRPAGDQVTLEVRDGSGRQWFTGLDVIVDDDPDGGTRVRSAHNGGTV